ncbi:ATP-dependent acetyltransferase [Citrobacter koseri]|uniref:ATP-dependent acetyltransferase n=1 Tax=Citrobacter koseri TaxID=545 RepID=A0A2X2XPK6_CITKO|nr:ATP-dependent acetyltransferase [Citrobacter koseri]
MLSGDASWCRERALALREALAGDWLWVATDAPAAPHCTPQALQTLLGREFRHAVFDAQLGFDASAFAALSGTLRAGSWLVLLTPPYSAWNPVPMRTRCAGATARSLLQRHILSSTSNA